MNTVATSTQSASLDPQVPSIEVKAFEIKPAGAWSRYWASIIDGQISSIPPLILTLIISTLRGERISLTSVENRELFGILLLIFYLPYYVYLTSAKGTTVGKDAYGLKVVRYKVDQNLTYSQSILREVIKLGLFIIPILGTVFYLINGLVIIFSKEKRGLHDRLVNSQVLRVKPAWKMKKQILFFGGYLVFIVILYFFWTTLTTSFKDYLPVQTTQVSTQQSEYTTYINSRDGWRIKYDDSKYRAPRLFSEGETNFGFPVTKPFRVEFNRARNVDEFCLDKFAIETKQNPSGLPILSWLAVNEYTYKYPGKIQDEIILNGKQAIRIKADNNQTSSGGGRKYNITYMYVPYEDKVFVLSYADLNSWDFPEVECKNNEQAIMQMFSTFEPL